MNYDFQLTDKLLEDVVSLELSKERIRVINIDKYMKDKLSTDTEIENLLQLSNILGYSYSYSDIRSIYVGRKIGADSEGESKKKNMPFLVNARRLEEYYDSIIDFQHGSDFDLNLLAHINKVLLEGIIDEWEVEMRPSNDMNDTFGYFVYLDKKFVSDWYKTTEELSSWLANQGSMKHGVFQTSIIFFDVLRTFPWKYGNRITSVMLFDYLLRKFDLNLNGYLSPIKFLYEYMDEIERSLVYSVENDNLQLWIERFVSSFTIFAKQNVTEIKSKIAEIEDKKRKESGFLDLNNRQLKILKYLQTIPQVKREEYVHMMGVSTMTAYRDLNELVNKNLLKVRGQGRGTKYMLVTK